MWNERTIARAIARQTFQRKYLCVVPNCTWTGHECDLLVVTENLRIIDVEIKISRADLKADAGKEKWWRRLNWQESLKYGPQQVRGWDAWKHREPLEWPRKVWKHYYALPREIWTPDLLAALPSSASGVILLDANKHHPGDVIARVERRATPNKDAKPISPTAVVDIARLASLRMWEAFAEIERAKVCSP